MIEFEYLCLRGHIPSGIDDLLFETPQFRIARHPATDKYAIDALGSQSFAEFGQPGIRRRMQDLVPEPSHLHLLTDTSQSSSYLFAVFLRKPRRRKR